MRLRRSAAASGLGVILALQLAGCGSQAASLDGAWRADDGSGIKTFQADGSCTGMYYNNGKPLDIGGGMTCTLGSKADDQGRYSLQVDQPPNSETLLIKFDGDSATVYSGDGSRLFSMTRQ